MRKINRFISSSLKIEKYELDENEIQFQNQILICVI